MPHQKSQQLIDIREFMQNNPDLNFGQSLDETGSGFIVVPQGEEKGPLGPLSDLIDTGLQGTGEGFTAVSELSGLKGA